MRIHELLMRDGVIQAPQLAVELEVDRRTISRDLTHMRDQLHLPIVYDRKRKGHCYSRTVTSLPWLQITMGDLLALTVARHEVDAYKGTPMEARMRDAFERLAGQLDEQLTLSWEGLQDAITFRPSSIPIGIEVATLDMMVEASTQCEEVRFDYTDPHGKQSIARAVQPHRMVRYKGGWYAVDHDSAKGETRKFALCRMKNVQRTGRHFVRNTEAIAKSFRHSIGIFGGGEPELVKLEFRGVSAVLVQENRWHESQAFRPVDNGRVEVTMQVAIDPELERWVLGWGQDVRVLSPDRLRETVRAQAEGILAGCREE